MNYKSTLIMPSTNFEMKANLNKKEPSIQDKWIKMEIEKRIYEQNKNFKTFILHDGPPYANGFLHVGHALNKILKDIIIRYKNMTSNLAIFIPGWDTHGMPIEVALSKQKSLANVSVVEKRLACKEFALDWIEVQKQQFIKMGTLSSMNKIYKTLDNDFEIEQLKIFNKMFLSGLIFQDLKPIYWSWSSQTALAEAEVEYKEVESDSIHVGFNVIESNILEKNDKLLIWTTTPWTIPSNLAIAAKAKIKYAKVKTNLGNIIVLEKNVNNIMGKIGIKEFSIDKVFYGEDLLMTKYKHPLYEKIGVVINDDYVSETEGTGLVHNAPGFGNDDYLACKKYNISPFCPIDEFGHFTKEVDDLEINGLFYLKANSVIIDKLSKNCCLLNHEKITHSAAHDWRTKKPLIYRATKQWFVNISKINGKINEELDKVIAPQGNEVIDRMREMINNRPEWCISRQRYWGVPITIIYDENKKPIINEKLQLNILRILEKEGTNVWFDKDAKYFLTSDFDKNKKYYKETDIMDVWFDSGSTHNVLKLNNLPYPADLYFEGKDQFRGWFNSSLITGVAHNLQSPYKSLLTHGFVLDKNGHKMSKSLGNVIDPMSVCEEYGADILRLWAANSEYSSDVRIFPELLKQTSEIYRRIRNTIFKFILGNLNDFDFANDLNYSKIDIYILNRLSDIILETKNHYENFNFKAVVKIMNEFAIELSSWYFDYIKDFLYCDSNDNEERKAIQSVLYRILEVYLLVLAPILPHTCEEAYENLNLSNKKDSIHLKNFDSLDYLIPKYDDENEWSILFDMKNKIFSKLEELRLQKIINKNNEAKVTFFGKKEAFSSEEICKFLNIAEFTFIFSSSEKIICEKSNNKKCLRCWNHFKDSEMENTEICKRCNNILKNKVY